MPLVRVALCLSALLILPQVCVAQASRFTGVSVERFDLGDGRFTTVAVRHTELGARGFGADLAVGLAPTGFPTLLLELDAGLARGVRLGPATLVLKAGMAGFISATAFEVYPGAQAGAALLLPVEQRLGLRVDLVQRRYWPRDSNAIGTWSIGIGFTVRRLPPRSP